MTRIPTLEVTTPSEREIAMTRVLDAPRRLVFEALTTPALLTRWLLGPPGWRMVVCEIDLTVGGAYRFEWRADDGRHLGMGGRYIAITPPEGYVATEIFDEAWYPGEAVVTTALTDHGETTTLTLTVRYASREARDGVLASGMARGVSASYDRLAELLAPGSGGG